MVVATGTWGAPDELERVTRGFLSAFGPGDGYGLHLVCSDRKSVSAEELCELAERPFEEFVFGNVLHDRRDRTEPH